MGNAITLIVLGVGFAHIIDSGHKPPRNWVMRAEPLEPCIWLPPCFFLRLTAE